MGGIELVQESQDSECQVRELGTLGGDLILYPGNSKIWEEKRRDWEGSPLLTFHSFHSRDVISSIRKVRVFIYVLPNYYKLGGLK